MGRVEERDKGGGGMVRGGKGEVRNREEKGRGGEGREGDERRES